MRQRRERLAASIQKALARDIHERYPGVYATVTEVEVAPDSKFAVVWVSIMDADREQSVFDELVANSGSLRHAITKTTDIRRVPHIELRLDKRGQHAQKISELTRDNK